MFIQLTNQAWFKVGHLNPPIFQATSLDDALHLSQGRIVWQRGPYTNGVSNWMCAIGISPMCNRVFWPNSGLTLRPWCWNRGWQAWQQRDGSNFLVIKCLPNSSWADIHCWYAIIDKAWEGQVVLAPKWVDDCDMWCTLKMRGRTSERLLRHAVETWYARAPLKTCWFVFRRSWRDANFETAPF